MKHIFKNNSPIGESPIDHYQLCWYDMEKDGICHDEDFISPHEFGNYVIKYLDCDQNKNDIERTRLFVWTKDKEAYELRLHKISPEEWEKCSSFHGGR